MPSLDKIEQKLNIVTRIVPYFIALCFLLFFFLLDFLLNLSINPMSALTFRPCWRRGSASFLSQSQNFPWNTGGVNQSVWAPRPMVKHGKMRLILSLGHRHFVVPRVILHCRGRKCILPLRGGLKSPITGSFLLTKPLKHSYITWHAAFLDVQAVCARRKMKAIDRPHVSFQLFRSVTNHCK